MRTVDVLIAGGGIAGLSAALACEKSGRSYLLVEPRQRFGGICDSWNWDGFSLDFGPHIFCAGSDDKGMEWFIEYAGDCYERPRNDRILIDGETYLYPIQKALSHLISSDYYGEVYNYQQYALANFGSVLTDKFFKPWNEKQYKRPATSLACDNLGSRSPSPDAVQQTYLYPKGGMQAFINGMIYDLDTYSLLNSTWIEHIDADTGTAVLSDSTRVIWGDIVWTAPLVSLPKTLTDWGSHLRYDLLTWVDLILMCVMTRRRLAMDWLALYVPTPGIPFHRLSFPRVINPKSVPKGRDCVQLEISVDNCSAYSMLDLQRKAIEGLKSIGILQADDNELNVYSRIVRKGYPVPKFSTDSIVKKIDEWLSEKNIHITGRMGAWRHQNIWPVVKQAYSVVEAIS